jgi:eukaryotic-like serine/threonine-protein kinase
MTANVTSAPASKSAAFAELDEQVIARVKAGDTVGLNQLIQNHPDHADELQRLLPAVQVMADLSRSGERAAHDVSGAESVGELGDFRIIREVGRGGMGIVYEAEQISLGRRVALKVLPFAATMDPKQLQRFRNEAKAAASLHHEHVVPVYGVGCERGVHYYAMQFIDGTTLADVIAEIKDAKELNLRGTEDTERKEKTSPKSSLCSLCLCGNKSAFFHQIAATIAQAADALE